MSFLDDLGGIFHAIGSTLAGGGSNTTPTNAPVKKPQQPVQQAPVIIRPTQPQPVFNINQGPNNALPAADPAHPLLNSRVAANNFLDQANNLQKTNPTATPAPTNGGGGFIHDITHGAEDVAKNVGGVAADTSLGVLRAGEGLVSGAEDLPNMAVHLITKPARMISGNDQFGQDLDKVDQQSQRLTNDAQDPVNALAKDTDNAAAFYGGNNLGRDLYKPVQIATNVATVLPGIAAIAGKVGEAGNITSKIADFAEGQSKSATVSNLINKVRGAIPLLNKANTATDTVTALSEADKAADEVATGVKSANPNQVQDAVDQTNLKNAQAAPTPAEVGPDAQGTPQTGEVPQKTALPQTQPEPAQSAPVQEPAQPVSPIETTPQPTPVSQPVSPTTPINSSSNPPVTVTPNNVAQLPNDVKPIPGTVTAANAPAVRATAIKDLTAIGQNEDKIAAANKGGWAKKVFGASKEHDVLSNDELNQAANRVISTMGDDELVSSYATGAKIDNSADLAKANAALPRLGRLSAAGNADATQAISNILDGAEQHVSESGRTLNYAQSMYNTLPKEAKVSYLVKSINRARVKSGLEVLSDAETAKATDSVNGYLTEIEDTENKAAAAEGTVQQLIDSARSGTQLSSDDIKTIDAAKASITGDRNQVMKLNTELARAYDAYAPTKATVTSVGDQAGNLGRSLMLTSASGRMSDILTTSINSVHSLLQQSGEAMLGKVINGVRTIAGKTPGKYIDTMPSIKALAQGTKEGLYKAAGNYKGDIYSPDVLKAIRSQNTGGKAELLRGSGTGVLSKVKNFSHAMAETATNLSQGVKNARVLQLAYQEGRQAGLEGNDLDIYAHGRATLPTKAMDQNGQHLLDEVNNMNDNPISTGLHSLSAAFDKIPIVGEQIRNITVPFTKWVGGQAWNGITDKNAVANVVKFAKALKAGDAQEAVHQVAGFATNTVGTMSAGYALAKAGLLTTKNAQGYNDDGLYIHLGRDFIPIGFLGFAAPGLVMGAATHEALNSSTHGSVAQKIMDVASNTMSTLGHAYLGNTLIGGSNEVTSALQNWLSGKDNVTGKDVVATAGSSAAEQYIPGAFGDLNAVLNNGIGPINSPLDPSHYAALTKVTNGQNGVLTKTGKLSTAKDISASALKGVEDKIPFLSQSMPRNPGVASSTLTDRVTRGDSSSTAEVKAAQVAQTAQEKVASDQKNGIPDPLATYKDAGGKTISFADQVENTVEGGHYQKAITGLNEQLASLKGQPASKTAPIQDQIKQLGILQNQNLSPTFRSTYANTTLTQWRALGDPTSSTYNPSLYQRLYDYDQALTAAGISGGSATAAGSKNTAKFYAATSSSSSSSSSAASDLVKSNVVGATPMPTRESFFTNLTAKDIPASIPQMKLTSPQSLIKTHKISVSTPSA